MGSNVVLTLSCLFPQAPPMLVGSRTKSLTTLPVSTPASGELGWRHSSPTLMHDTVLSPALGAPRADKVELLWMQALSTSSAP